MKKVISVLLALVMIAVPMSVFAAAEGGDDTPDKVCRITPPAESYMFTLEPVEGYEYYVREGDDFQFTVKPKDGYSLEFAVVYYFATDILEGVAGDEILQTPVEPDEDGVYTIDRVTTDITIVVSQVTEARQANLFSNIRYLLHLIFAVLGKLFGFDVDAVNL
ncbi:MAG: hypothetical protein IJL26_03060 [Clostridia bacterium]|nr:hypothetical protein [Clostridia bacterium]